MKKILLSMLAVVMVTGLLLSVSVTPALAGEIYRFKGTGASAYWFSYDEGTGVYTDVFLYGYDSVSQSPPGRPQAEQRGGVGVFQYRYEGDQFVPLFEIYYWGTLPAGCLDIEQKLGAASLVAEGLKAWKWDYVAAEGSVVSLDVAVSWVATGELSRESERWRYTNPYFKINYRYTGRWRPATAQGSIYYNGNSIILGASTRAEIFSARQGYVEISR